MVGGTPQNLKSDSIVVSNLDANINEDDLRNEIFADIADISNVILNYDRNGSSQGSATVVFSSTASARRACADYNGAMIDGRPMSVLLIASLTAPKQIVKRNQVEAPVPAARTPRTIVKNTPQAPQQAPAPRGRRDDDRRPRDNGAPRQQFRDERRPRDNSPQRQQFRDDRRPRDNGARDNYRDAAPQRRNRDNSPRDNAPQRRRDPLPRDHSTPRGARSPAPAARKGAAPPKAARIESKKPARDSKAPVKNAKKPAAKKPAAKKPVTAEDLDRQMDAYNKQRDVTKAGQP